MSPDHRLVPAAQLAAKDPIRNPNESAEYRTARIALLAEEIDLRRHVERVAAMRRALPPGGEVTADYRFTGTTGRATLATLFGDHDTLAIYSYMFGPGRTTPCPMCTSFMRTWALKMPAVNERIALVFVARSPIEQLVEWRAKLSLHHLPVYSDGEGAFTRDYVNPDDEDMPGMNVFRREGGVIRHFWRAEMNGEMADPGQDARGAVDLDSLWNLLDLTPGGRGTDWYPKL